MSRIVIAKRDNPFIQIDKTCLLDDRLSWKAKGLFAYLMSLPADWKIYTTEVKRHSVDGRDSLHSAMRELELYGYLTKTAQRISGKWHGYDYMLHDRPEGSVNYVNSSIQPETGKPDTAKPDTENPPLLISYNTNTKDSHKNEKPTASKPDSSADEKKEWHGKGYEDLYLKFLSVVKLSPAVYPFSKNRKLINTIAKTTSLHDFRRALNAATKDEWLIKKTAGDLAYFARQLPVYLNHQGKTDAEYLAGAKGEKK